MLGGAEEVPSYLTDAAPSYLDEVPAVPAQTAPSAPQAQPLDEFGLPAAEPAAAKKLAA